ncbi:MAG TPA: hypothetical protein DHW71_08700 [Gammaproteobacteria bacterium]|nr:hypothetical protein [Gammaproteobacteria bacterium]HBF06649.1 hypothetical protein [Gammaproteobacteria bacterium]HCK93052.1 hypothetical protein [Gammaproteobacteria bacterium]|tara:strand:- start:274 stop:666 length:393 start_codon:yes stop_codon:yes gene_type:complete
MKAYSGSCHCGKVRFTAELKLDHVRVCNCSICLMRGALNHRVEKQNFILESPWNDLGIYEWGPKNAKDYFCKICGIMPFRRPGSLTKIEIEQGKIPFEGYAINVRCLQGVNIDQLPIQYINGKELVLDSA